MQSEGWSLNGQLYVSAGEIVNVKTFLMSTLTITIFLKTVESPTNPSHGLTLKAFGHPARWRKNRCFLMLYMGQCLLALKPPFIVVFFMYSQVLIIHVDTAANH